MISLHQNELEALRILWEGGELKPAEIQAKFSWPIDNGTLRSALENLVEKKHITRKQQGKAFYYEGVADTHTTWPTRDSHSAKLRGRLSSAEGRRKP